LVAFDPNDANLIVAGGVDSGVFVSSDAGATWLLVTDPRTPGQSGIPHVPRPLYAYFDHDPPDRIDIYVGTRGKGMLRIGFRPPRASFQYAAKLICGDTTDTLGLRLIRGRYATTINIHNPNAADVTFQKRLSLSFPPAEQIPGLQRPIAWDHLKPDEALKTDCIDIRERLFPTGFPGGYIEGFVTLRSEKPLDVTGVYTTGDVNPTTNVLVHSSIELQQIVERDLRSDLRIEKTAYVFPYKIQDRLTLFFVLYVVKVQNLGAQDAHNVQVADNLVMVGSNIVNWLGFLTTPILLPPGGSVTGTTSGPGAASIGLKLGDLAAGGTTGAMFWAIASVYETGSPATAGLVNTAVTSSDEGDSSPLDNTVVVNTPVIP
jgi:hypothetical protein